MFAAVSDTAIVASAPNFAITAASAVTCAALRLTVSVALSVSILAILALIASILETKFSAVSDMAILAAGPSLAAIAVWAVVKLTMPPSETLKVSILARLLLIAAILALICSAVPVTTMVAPEPNFAITAALLVNWSAAMLTVPVALSVSILAILLLIAAILEAILAAVSDTAIVDSVPSFDSTLE